MSHRVLTLIPFLNYGEMTKILPKEKMFTSSVVPCKGGSYFEPKLAKKLGPSDYGLLIEEVVECILFGDDMTSVKHVTDVNQWLPLKEFVNKYFLDTILQPQVPIVCDDIVGHPDFMSHDTIYDVKTTGRFGSMRINTILQLLSYYCLAKMNELPIKCVALILPLQLKVVSYNLESWDYIPFYKLLLGCIDAKISKELTCNNMEPINQLLFLQMYHQFVGHHCHKDDLFSSSVITKPLQFFLSGNATSKISFTKKFKTSLKKINLKSTAPVFIHSPYLLNLSYPGKGERRNDEEIRKELGPKNAYGSWTFYCLKQLLEFGHETNVKGVVIHVGKCCGNDYKQSVDNMYKAIIDCAVYATEQCPILVETPAGQQGEILNTPEEMADFYASLPDDVKKVTGICVDTTHVFSACHDPLGYLMIMEQRNIPIHLVHYNDSKVMKGACKDRHACIGKGYIGLQSLFDVLNYCVKKNIPMLTE